MERKVKPQQPPKFTHFLHFLHERLTIEKSLTRQQQQIKQNDPKLEPTLDQKLFLVYLFLLSFKVIAKNFVMKIY